MDVQVHFPDDKITQSILERYLYLFRIDYEYPAIMDLLDTLIGYVPLATKADIPSLGNILPWSQLENLRLALRQKGKMLRGPKGISASAAGRILAESPLASAFLANSSADSKAQYHGLRLVLLVFLAVNKNDDQTNKSICDEIRLSSSELEEQNKLLLQLPIFGEGTCEHYYADLFEAVKKSALSLSKNPTELSPKQKNFVAHLSRLTDLPQSRTKIKKVPNIVIPIKSQKDDVIPFSGSLIRSYEFNHEGSKHDSVPTQHIIYENKESASTDSDVFLFSAKQARYWLEKNESLSEIDSSRLNLIEKRILSDYIQSVCVSIDFHDSLPGLLIALIYLTGFDLNRVLNSPLGTAGFINSNGKLIKNLPPPPIAYMGKNTANLSEDILEISLPDCVQKWFKIHQHHLYDDANLLQLSAYSEEVLIIRVKEELALLRDGGRFRIKLQRLSSCLASELTVTFRNPIYTSILAGDFKTQPPVLMYYCSITADELLLAYEKACHSLLLDQPQGLLFGAELPKPKLPMTIESFISRISRKTELAIGSYPSDMITAHNALTHYTAAMLSFALGHRPVIDPHCYFNDINPELMASLVSDKVVDPRHEFRYQAIPLIALQQIQGYVWHLKRLAIILIKKKVIDTKPLGITILKMLRGEKTHLPLLFTIDEFDLPTQSITPKAMKNYWQEYGDIPLNAGRSIMATELINSGISSPLVELFLGHFHGINHPWGDRSSRIPAIDVALLSKSIDTNLQKMGWHVITPQLPQRDRLNINRRLKKQDYSVHRSTLLGPEQRNLNRKKRLAKVKLLVRDVIQTTFSEEIPSTVPASTLSIVRESIIKQAEYSKLSQQECLLFLNRWIVKKISQGAVVEGFKRIRPINVEPSPINRATFSTLGELNELRTALENYTACHDTLDSTVFAELILRAVCFGGLGDPDFIPQLPTMMLTNSYQMERDIFIEFDRFRWYPDNTSLCLMIHIQKRKESLNDELISENMIRRALVNLLGEFKIKVSSKLLYPYLESLALSCQKLYLPGFLRSSWSSEYASSNLPFKSYIRLLTNKRINHTRDDESKIQNTPQDKWLPSLISVGENNASIDVKSIKRDFQAIFTQVNDVAPQGQALRSKVKRNRLAKKFKNYVDDKPSLAPIVKLLMAWLVARCKSGVHKDKLAASTIQRYLQELVNPLLHLVGNHNLSQFTSEDFDELYIQLLDWGNNVDQPYRLGRIYDFHTFMMQTYGVERPDWSMLFSLAGENAPTPEIDANALTVSEYDTALDLIENDPNLSDWLKNRYGMLLILGYRFGLRFGEAMRLQWRNVQLGSNNVIILQIHNNIFGEVKSSSGVRQVPLLGIFSHQEHAIFNTVMQQSEAWFSEDIQVALLFEGEPRQLIQRDEAGLYLNALLKHVSADPSLRFHHLRHTWVTRAIATAFPVPTSQVWSTVRSALIGRLGESNSALFWGKDQELSQKLQAISDATGHTRIQTTLSSYFHLSDVLGSAYLAETEIEIQIKVLSKMLDKTENTLYRRKSRSDAHSFIDAVTNSEKTNLLFINPLSTVTTIKRLPCWTGAVETVGNTTISLQLIDRLLLLVSRRQGDTAQLSEITGIHQSEISTLVHYASHIELESGFDFYSAYQTTNDEFIKKPLTTPSNENVLESKRIAVLAKILDSEIDNSITSAITAWKSAYRHNKKEWQFDSQDKIIDFLLGLKIIGLGDASFELYVPKSITLSLATKLKSSLNIEFIPTDEHPNMTTHIIKQFITLKIKALPKIWGTFHTVNRMLFCISICIAHKSRSD